MTPTVPEQAKHTGFSCDEEILTDRKEQIYGRKTYSSISSRSARSRHYHIVYDQKWRERSHECTSPGCGSQDACGCDVTPTSIENSQNRQSIVRSRERCRNSKNERCLKRTSLDDRVIHNLGLIHDGQWHAAGRFPL